MITAEELIEGVGPTRERLLDAMLIDAVEKVVVACFLRKQTTARFVVEDVLPAGALPASYHARFVRVLVRELEMHGYQVTVLLDNPETNVLEIDLMVTKPVPHWHGPLATEPVRLDAEDLQALRSMISNHRNGEE